MLSKPMIVAPRLRPLPLSFFTVQCGTTTRRFLFSYDHLFNLRYQVPLRFWKVLSLFSLHILYWRVLQVWKIMPYKRMVMWFFFCFLHPVKVTFIHCAYLLGLPLISGPVQNECGADSILCPIKFKNHKLSQNMVLETVSSVELRYFLTAPISWVSQRGISWPSPINFSISPKRV
jgi:hypothetical protein